MWQLAWGDLWVSEIKFFHVLMFNFGLYYGVCLAAGGVWELSDQQTSSCVLLIRLLLFLMTVWWGRRGGLGSAITADRLSPVATVHWSSLSVNMGRWTLHSFLFLTLLCSSSGQFDTVGRYVSDFCSLLWPFVSLKCYLLINLCSLQNPLAWQVCVCAKRSDTQLQLLVSDSLSYYFWICSSDFHQ